MNSFDWFTKKNIFLAVGVFCIGMLGFAFFLNRSEKRAEQAIQALYEADQIFLKESDAQAVVQKEQSTKTNLKLPLQFQKAIEAYQNLFQKFSSLPPGIEAGFKLAAFYFNSGFYEDALSIYRLLSQKTSQLNYVFALSGMGSSLENLNQYSEAIANYQKAYKKAVSLHQEELQADCLQAMARSYELNQQLSEAKRTYHQIMNDYANTAYAQLAALYQSRLDRLEVRP